MNKLLKRIKMFFCPHKWVPVEYSRWYFHYKCSKCGQERGAGNFKPKY